ncbi:MAG TPA: TadE/TadG family type IV pilus assembly protein [Thermomicrobiales bacterium]|nr:TadE/TadG family type IV pilus assembly protein [Thermomicrobiales bacterium]
MLPTMLENSPTHATSGHEEAGAQPARSTKCRKKSRGQSLVELAVLLPVLVMILAAAADMGRALTAYIAISGATREGAAYGMQSADQAIDTAGIATTVQNDIGNGGAIWGTSVGVVSSAPNDAQGYQQVVVTVSYSFSPIIPIPALPSTINMDRTVRMRVLN